MKFSTFIFIAAVFMIPLQAGSSAGVNDPYFPYQDYLEQIHVPQVWNLSTGQDDVLVAVLDQGVDFTHPDLYGQTWVNTDEVPGNGRDDDGNGYVDDYNGYNFLYNTGNVSRTYGSHGTFIAGIIGATANNYQGISGINHHVKILPVIVCDGFGTCDDEATVAGIKYAAEQGADVINISIGGSGWNEAINRQYQEAISYAFSRGSLVVIAAGNGFSVSGNGKNLNVLKNSPICNDQNDDVLGVTSVDGDNRKSVFADFGSDCVDIAAPGESILSLSLPEYDDDGLSYGYGDGTSFSTAIVSGVAALVKSSNYSLSNRDIHDILLSSSTMIDYLNPRYQGHLGSGVVNAFQAVQEAQKVQSTSFDMALAKRLKGRLLLQVEQHGEIWYVDTNTFNRHRITQQQALKIFRKLSLGISNKNLEKIPIAGSWSTGSRTLRTRLAGKLLLQVEEHGEIWYVDSTGFRHLITTDNIMAIFRKLSLGISDENLMKIPVGDI